MNIENKKRLEGRMYDMIKGHNHVTETVKERGTHIIDDRR